MHMRVALPILLIATLLWTDALAAGWEVIKQEDGIVVSRKEVPGRDLPIFRGETEFDGSIYELLAILDDFGSHTQWMHSCEEAYAIKRYSAQRILSYYRTRAPWPVSSRDVVIENSIDLVTDSHAVIVTYKSVTSPLKPEVEDVVRMPRLRGYFHFRALSKTRTWLRYEVDADAGGSLPKWVAAMASEDIPYHTLINLRDRLPAARGKYEKFLDQWDPRRNPAAPNLFP